MRYNKQRSLCVTLLRKAKKKYYTDRKMSDTNDNNKFWENVNEVIIDYEKLAQIFDECLISFQVSLSLLFTRRMIM